MNVDLNLKFPENTDAISLILKLVGEVCNLNCAYCYEKRKPYSGQRLLDPDFISKVLKNLSPHPVSIELHGGEPLLYPKEKFKQIFHILRNYEPLPLIRIQTNGTLMDIEWMEFLLNEWPTIEIGVSIDGDLSSNNLRFDYKNRDSYASVIKCLDRLSSKNINIGVISVVNNQSVNNYVSILNEFLSHKCIKTVKFVPCFDMGTNGIKSWAITPNQYADFLISIFKYWKDRDMFRSFLIEPHISVIKKIKGYSTVNCHYSESKCAFVYTLYPDGTFGTCDEFNKVESLIHVDDLNLTSIIEAFGKTNMMTELNSLLQKCKVCTYYSICGGGCLATRKRLENSRLDDEYCNYRIKIIDYISSELNDVGQ